MIGGQGFREGIYLAAVLGWAFDDFESLLPGASAAALKEAASILGAEACPDDAMERRAQAGLRAIEKELAKRTNTAKESP